MMASSRKYLAPLRFPGRIRKSRFASSCPCHGGASPRNRENAQSLCVPAIRFQLHGEILCRAWQDRRTYSLFTVRCNLRREMEIGLVLKERGRFTIRWSLMYGDLVFQFPERVDAYCTARDCAGACAGLCRRIWSVPGGGPEEMFCLRSRSTACSVATSWAISSCLAASCFWSAASCSRLRLTRARSSDSGLSCWPKSEEGSAMVGDGGNNQPSDGTQVLTISFPSSWWDCHASVAPTPIRTTKEKRARVRNIRLPIDGLSARQLFTLEI